MRTVTFVRAALTACAAFAAVASHAATATIADRISTQIDQTLRYPLFTTARDDDEGMVLVTFVVGQLGRAQDIQVIDTSGFPKLDKSAVIAITKLRALPSQAVGRHVLAVLNFRLYDAGDDDRQAKSTRRRIEVALARLRKSWPDGLVIAH